MRSLSLLFLMITLTACVEETPSSRPVESQTPGLETSSTILTLQRSQAFRTPEKRQYFESELAVFSRGEKPLTDYDYFNIPVIDKHIEGYKLGSKYLPVAPDTIDCDGDDENAASLAQFKDYCRTRLAAKKRTWLGSDNSITGEGDWQMVAKIVNNGKSFEVWEDISTGLIWSDIVTQATWCKASGSRDTDCNPEDLGELPCFGKDDSIIELAKGNMNKLAKVIDWRLPTRNEYLQADLNGIRNVIPAFRRNITSPASTTNSVPVWTATVDSRNSSKAWLYDGRYGVLSSEAMTEERSVICVGRVLIP